MYCKNDVVSYCTKGVCKITDVVEKNTNNLINNYYVLKPLYDDNTTIFIPTDNFELVKKMRHISTKDKVYVLIDKLSSEDTNWIENSVDRKEEYKNIIQIGEHEKLLRVIKTLQTQKEKLKEEGKKLSLADETIFKEAEDKLYREFAVILDIDYKKVPSFIALRIKRKSKGH